jgi:hypothetical protein
MEYQQAKILQYLKQCEKIDILSAREQEARNEVEVLKKKDREGETFLLTMELVTIGQEKNNADKTMIAIKKDVIADLQQLHKQAGFPAIAPAFVYEASNGYAYSARLNRDNEIDVSRTTRTK